MYWILAVLLCSSGVLAATADNVFPIAGCWTVEPGHPGLCRQWWGYQLSSNTDTCSIPLGRGNHLLYNNRQTNTILPPTEFSSTLAGRAVFSTLSPCSGSLVWHLNNHTAHARTGHGSHHCRDKETEFTRQPLDTYFPQVETAKCDQHSLNLAGNDNCVRLDHEIRGALLHTQVLDFSISTRPRQCTPGQPVNVELSWALYRACDQAPLTTERFATITLECAATEVHFGIDNRMNTQWSSAKSAVTSGAAMRPAINTDRGGQALMRAADRVLDASPNTEIVYYSVKAHGTGLETHVQGGIVRICYDERQQRRDMSSRFATDGKLEAIAECTSHVDDNQPDLCRSWFSYRLSNTTKTQHRPISSLNTFLTTPFDRGQPTYFSPGLHSYVFSVLWNCSDYGESTGPMLSWQLDTTGVASRRGPMCRVGCDGIQGSTTQYDQCGVCGGTGQSCGYSPRQIAASCGGQPPESVHSVAANLTLSSSDRPVKVLNPTHTTRPGLGMPNQAYGGPGVGNGGKATNTHPATSVLAFAETESGAGCMRIQLPQAVQMYHAAVINVQPFCEGQVSDDLSCILDSDCPGGAAAQVCYNGQCLTRSLVPGATLAEDTALAAQEAAIVNGYMSRGYQMNHEHQRCDDDDNVTACDDGHPCTVDVCVCGYCMHRENRWCCEADEQCPPSFDPCEEGYCNLDVNRCDRRRNDDALCCSHEYLCEPLSNSPCRQTLCVDNQCTELPLGNNLGCCETASDCEAVIPQLPHCALHACQQGECVVMADPACCFADTDCPAAEPDSCLLNFCVNGTCIPGPDPSCCAIQDDCQVFPPEACLELVGCTDGQCQYESHLPCCTTSDNCQYLLDQLDSLSNRSCYEAHCTNGLCELVDLCPPCDYCTTVADCHPQTLCTVAQCIASTCVYSPLDCSDELECSIDACSGGVCVHDISNCPTMSATVSSSLSMTPSLTSSSTMSATVSASPSPSGTLSGTLSRSVTISTSTSTTVSLTGSLSGSASISATLSPSGSVSATARPSVTSSETVSSTVSMTAGATASVSPSLSTSSTLSGSASLSTSTSTSISTTISTSVSTSASLSPSSTLSATMSLSATTSLTASRSGSLSPTLSPSATVSPTASRSGSLSVSPSLTSSMSPTPSESYIPQSSKPGHGYGDDKHNHTGPPGQGRKRTVVRDPPKRSTAAAWSSKTRSWLAAYTAQGLKDGIPARRETVPYSAANNGVATVDLNADGIVAVEFCSCSGEGGLLSLDYLVPGTAITYDRCGVCGGDGSTCHYAPTDSVRIQTRLGTSPLDVRILTEDDSDIYEVCYYHARQRWDAPDYTGQTLRIGFEPHQLCSLKRAGNCDSLILGTDWCELFADGPTNLANDWTYQGLGNTSIAGLECGGDLLFSCPIGDGSAGYRVCRNFTLADMLSCRLRDQQTDALTTEVLPSHRVEYAGTIYAAELVPVECDNPSLCERVMHQASRRIRVRTQLDGTMVADFNADNLQFEAHVTGVTCGRDDSVRVHFSTTVRAPWAKSIALETPLLEDYSGTVTALGLEDPIENARMPNRCLEVTPATAMCTQQWTLRLTGPTANLRLVAAARVDDTEMHQSPLVILLQAAVPCESLEAALTGVRRNEARLADSTVVLYHGGDQRRSAYITDLINDASNSFTDGETVFGRIFTALPSDYEAASGDYVLKLDEFHICYAYPGSTLAGYIPYDAYHPRATGCMSPGDWLVTTLYAQGSVTGDGRDLAASFVAEGDHINFQFTAVTATANSPVYVDARWHVEWIAAADTRKFAADRISQHRAAALSAGRSADDWLEPASQFHLVLTPAEMESTRRLISTHRNRLRTQLLLRTVVNTGLSVEGLRGIFNGTVQAERSDTSVRTYGPYSDGVWFAAGYGYYQSQCKSGQEANARWALPLTESACEHCNPCEHKHDFEFPCVWPCWGRCWPYFWDCDHSHHGRCEPYWWIILIPLLLACLFGLGLLFWKPVPQRHYPVLTSQIVRRRTVRVGS